MEQQGARPGIVVSEIVPAEVANARFGYQLTVTGPADGRLLLDACRAAVFKLGGVFAGETPAGIAVSFGSAILLRLMGAFFTPRRKWPIKLLCEVAPASQLDGQPALRLTASEAFGFGTLVGFESKYRERCQAVLAEVSSEMAKELAAAPTR